MWSRSGKANVEDEVSESQIQGSAACRVDDECEQDDDQDDDHQPKKNTTIAGIDPPTVLALTTAHSYPAPPGLSAPGVIAEPRILGW